MAENKKKVYRIPKVGWIGGVCAGIAYKLNIETWIVRLVWFTLICFYGFGLGLYILFWIFMPKAETPEDYKEVCD
jgi:phage shock protein PspC (stress-responsive transcriptional regulator)